MPTAVALLLLLVPLAGHGDDLVVQHLDGSARVSLTGGVGFASGPVWSRDGSKIAFLTNGDTTGHGAAGLDVVNVDGSGLLALTPGLAAADPTWSPEGTQIAFASGDASGADVWTVPASGGSPRRLTADHGLVTSLAWSPTGSAILYGSASGGLNALFMLDPLTGGARKLTDSAYLLGGPAGAWSPDGTQIAFADPQGQLSVIAPDGTGARTLDDQALVDLPSWSPDGATLAFTARRVLPGPPSRYGPYVTADIWTVGLHSGRKLRLTGAFDDVTQTPWAAVGSAAPSWWPDGSRLFFNRNPFPRTNAWQMNADGSCEQPVPATANALGPVWQPGRSVPGGSLECADLRVRVVATSEPIALAKFADTTVVVENDGNLPATEVRARMTSGQKATLSLPPCASSECGLGTIGPHESRTFAAFAGGVTKPGSVTITIAATSDATDATPADASATATIEVLNCSIAGTSGADVLFGTPHADRICGRPGPDRISGGKGDDYLDAGNGDDTIIGGPGRDTIIARGGNDVIDARDGQLDWIDCGTEHDIAIVDRIDHTAHCEKVLRR